MKPPLQRLNDNFNWMHCLCYLWEASPSWDLVTPQTIHLSNLSALPYILTNSWTLEIYRVFVTSMHIRAHVTNTTKINAIDQDDNGSRRLVTSIRTVNDTFLAKDLNWCFFLSSLSFLSLFLFSLLLNFLKKP